MRVDAVFNRPLHGWRECVWPQLLLALLCAGCASNYVGPLTGKTYTTYALINGYLYGGGPEYEQEVKVSEYLQRYPNTTTKLKQLMLERKIAIGMTKEQVRISWRDPTDINRTVYKTGSQEQWVYGSPLSGARYLYFDDDRLTSWQD